jgi:TorA maturation chaperone TorD
MSISELHAGLQLVSRLFSYPVAQNALQLRSEGILTVGEALLAEVNDVDHIRLENEYVRLFINAMPEVPCAPYGSVYLEGSVMGESTVKIAAIYQKYGITTEELADHIAVESEFLAWLYVVAGDDVEAKKDFDYLLCHLKKWTGPFFNQIEEHDQLGFYRRCAGVARVLLSMI